MSLKQFIVLAAIAAVVSAGISWYLASKSGEPELGITGTATTTASTQRVFTAGINNASSTLSSVNNNTKRSCIVEEVFVTATDTPNFFNRERIFVATNTLTAWGWPATNTDQYLIDSEAQHDKRDNVSNRANYPYFSLSSTTPQNNATIGPVSRVFLPGAYMHLFASANSSGTPEGVFGVRCNLAN